MRARIKSTPGLLADSAAVALEEGLGEPAAGAAGEGTVDFVSGAIMRSIAPGGNVNSQITPSSGRGQRAADPAEKYAMCGLPVYRLRPDVTGAERGRRTWQLGVQPEQAAAYCAAFVDDCRVRKYV